MGQKHILFSTYIKIFGPNMEVGDGPKASQTAPDVAKSIYYFPAILKLLAHIWKLEGPKGVPEAGDR